MTRTLFELGLFERYWEDTPALSEKQLDGQYRRGPLRVVLCDSKLARGGDARSSREAALEPGPPPRMESSTHCLTAERRREGTWHRGA